MLNVNYIIAYYYSTKGMPLDYYRATNLSYMYVKTIVRFFV